MTAVAALSSLGAKALRYAEHGWHVFPLQPREKKPLLSRGFLAATNEPSTVRGWWQGRPDANIGLWPGASGLIVVDLDGPQGETNGSELGLLSEPTLQVVTGRAEGGRHLYFRRPDFSVTNRSVAEKIDVRCDAGYVILPPSVHPTGRVYRWLGSVEEIRELPPTFLEVLRAAPDSGGAGDAKPASDIAFLEEIAEGGRNNALTRYAGRLLAKGMSELETLSLVNALNESRCNPPLPPNEIIVMVTGLAQREHAKRTTSTGTTLALVDEAPSDEIPTPAAVAAEQVQESRALLSRDITSAPRWEWPSLDRIVGPMLPGDLVVVGSLMGNGKSTLLMSQMDAFARAKMPTLYIPLEIDPAVCRVRWAAWRIGIDVRAAVRQEWDVLGEGAREALELTLEEQEADPYVHFAPPKRITLARMEMWCRWAREQFNCRVVMLDHLHRMDFGSDALQRRVTVTDVVRRLKDMAREIGVVLIAAAQLNRSSDPIDQFSAPALSRLKESAGIAEEADVVLMLSRKLRRDLPAQWQNALRLGQVNEREISVPNALVVTCRKHRLDNDAMNARTQLLVENGRVEEERGLWSRPNPGTDDRRFGE
jgi:hypothetical protein